MEEQSVLVSRLDVISNSLVRNLVPWVVILAVLVLAAGFLTDLEVLYLFGILANLFAGAAILGLVPGLVDRRRNETLLLNSEGIRWSGGEIRLADIRKVRLYERPDGDIR